MSLWTIRFRDNRGDELEACIEAETGFAAWATLCRERTAKHLDTPGFCSCDIVAAEEPTEVDNEVPDPEWLGPQEYISSDDEDQSPKEFSELAAEYARLSREAAGVLRRMSEARDAVVTAAIGLYGTAQEAQQEWLRERAALLEENARLRNEQAFALVIAEQASTGGVWEGDPDANDHD